MSSLTVDDRVQRGWFGRCRKPCSSNRRIGLMKLTVSFISEQGKFACTYQRSTESLPKKAISKQVHIKRGGA
jgi:hypothetical protein